MLPVTMRRRREAGDEPAALMRREFNRLFRPWFDLDLLPEECAGGCPVDIREDDEAIYIDAEVPGFRQEEINVTLEQGMLRIEAERKPEEEQKGTQHLKERRYTRLERSFSLPMNVDDSKVEANLDSGILHLRLPKTEETKPRKIEVR